jgi:hypothetical protein
MTRLVIDLDDRLHAPFLARARLAFRTPKEQASWELALRLEDRLEPRSTIGTILQSHADALAGLASLMLEPPERAPWVAAPLEIVDDDGSAEEPQPEH